jgi:hypothetical protein
LLMEHICYECRILKKILLLSHCLQDGKLLNWLFQPINCFLSGEVNNINGIHNHQTQKNKYKKGKKVQR